MIASRPDLRHNDGMKLHLSPLLAERQITQTAFADALGVNKSYVSDLVAGKKEPSFDTLRRMVDVLGVPVATLFGERAATTPPPTGFAESQAERFEFAETGTLGMQAKLYNAMRSTSRTPTAYRILRHIPSLAMRSGDVLVVDLGTPARDGDTVLIGLTDRQGFNAVTLVRRMVNRFAFSGEIGEADPAIDMTSDPRAAWRGTVKGLLRDRL